MNTTIQYTGSVLDRGDQLRRHPEAIEQLWQHPECRLVPLLDNRNLFILPEAMGGLIHAALPTRTEIETHLSQAGYRIFLGQEEGIPYFTLEINAIYQSALTEQLNGKFIDLRSVGSQLSQPVASLLAYARAMIYWQKHNRFCGLCGTVMTATHGGHVLQCAGKSCQQQIYPRTDPAVIMLVEHTDKAGVQRCLLGRHPNWQGKTVSTLAGFVEPGESLEEAVRREVLEEAGVKIGRVEYIASQPWPFPAAIMLGFIAQAVSSDITLDTQELAEAYWFNKDELMTFGEWGSEGDYFKLPSRDSIARFLIDYWLEL